MFFCILFIPPLYFMIRGKWGGFAVNACIYGLACILAISIIGTVFAPIPWLFAVAHASWCYRQEKMVEHATLIANKMAEKMSQMKTAPPVPTQIQK